MDDFASWIGTGTPTAREGGATLDFVAGREHLNRAGTVHGGVLATLVDAVMGAAVRSATDDADTPATSQLSVAYLRPGEPGELRVSAQVRKRGEHLLVCEAEVEQQDRALIHAVATFALLPGS
jgi:uncharacterized protein (TIGR00369 family)